MLSGVWPAGRVTFDALMMLDAGMSWVTIDGREKLIGSVIVRCEGSEDRLRNFRSLLVLVDYFMMFT